MISNVKLGIGVVGIGFGAKVQIPAFQREGIKVIAVCSRNGDCAKKVANQFKIPFYFSNFRHMLGIKNLDAISIATPYQSHREISEVSLKAGKHVLCEKPFASNISEAFSMREVARKNSHLTAMIDHEFRWLPQWAYIRDLIKDGYIGKFEFVRVNFFLGLPQEKKKSSTFALDNIHLTNEFLWGICSHYIDIFRFWFGDICGVRANMFVENAQKSSSKIHNSEKMGPYFKENLSILLDFNMGGRGMLLARKCMSEKKGTVEIEIIGKEGSLFVAHHNFKDLNIENDLVLGSRLASDYKKEKLEIPSKYFAINDKGDSRIIPFRHLVRSFISGISETKSPKPNFEDGYRCQQVLDASVKSALTKKIISVQQN